jgi:zinc protease
MIAALAAGCRARLLRPTLLFLWCAGLASAAGQAPQPGTPCNERPEKFVRTAGLPCIYQRDLASPMTAVGLFVGGGKSAVPPGLDGLASLATRLALEIPDEGKVRDLMAQATRMSFVCLEDYAVILIECLSENLAEALRVAAKIILDPLITGLRVGRAKEIMTIYGRVDEDDSVAAAYNAVIGALFAGKGYGTALYGTEASLKTIDRKDVLSFYNRLFTRQNAFFCVETDLEKDPVRRLLEKFFAKFPDREAVDVPRNPPILPADRDIYVKKDTQQTYVGRAYILPPPDASAHAKGYVLETLLGKGPGSRLWGLRAVEKLAYGVEANLIWTKSAGILTAYLETGRAKSAEAAAALDRTLADIQERGITEEELSTARTMAKARFLRSAESKSPRLRTLGLFEVLGLGIEHFCGIFGAIDAVTLEAMNAFIREALAPDRALRVTIGPAPSSPAER